MLIGMLVVTRIKQIGLKGLMTSTEPWFAFSLPGLSDITVTESLTIIFGNIFGSGVAEKYQTLYVPRVDSVRDYRLDLHPAVQNQI